MRNKRETPRRNRGDSNPQFTGTNQRSGRRIVRRFTGKWLKYSPTNCVILPAPPITIGESSPCTAEGRGRKPRGRLCAAWRRVRRPSEGNQNHPKSSPTPKVGSPEQAAAEAEKAAKGKVRTYVVQPAIRWYRFRRNSIRRLRAGRTFSTPTRTSWPIPTNSRQAKQSSSLDSWLNFNDWIRV